MGRKKSYNRDRKLVEARNIFWERGYNNISTNALIRDLGMVKQSFYDEFVSKEHLYTLVLEDYAEQGRKTMFQSMQGDISLDTIRDALYSMLEITALDESFQSCMMANTSIELGLIEDKFKKIVNRHMTSLTEQMTGVLDHLKEMGEIREDVDTTVFSNLLNMAYSGSGIVSRAGIDHELIKKSIDLMLDLIKAEI